MTQWGSLLAPAEALFQEALERARALGHEMVESPLWDNTIDRYYRCTTCRRAVVRYVAHEPTGRALAEECGRLVDVERRFLYRSRVAHAIRVDDRSDAAACGRLPGLWAEWLGTGSQAETDAAQILPRCKRCTEKLGDNW